MARYKQCSTLPGSVWTDWEQPTMRGYKMACCDCGLVHVLNFRVMKVTRWLGNKRSNSVQVRGHKVQFRVKRDNRATAQVRRRMGKEAAE